MTAKDKALNLINRFIILGMSDELSIKSALIVVDEVLINSSSYAKNVFWQDVKTELITHLS